MAARSGFPPRVIIGCIHYRYASVRLNWKTILLLSVASLFGSFFITLWLTEPTTPTSWNPFDKSTGLTLSNGNLIFTTGQSGWEGVRTVASASAGKKYWELTATSITSQSRQIVEGIANSSVIENKKNLGQDSNGIGWAANGNVYMNSAVVATIQGWQQGDVLSFAVDLGSRRIWFRTNAGSWNNDPANDPATNTGGIDISTLAAGPYFAFGQGGDSDKGDTLTANFGGSPFAQPVPAGFKIW